jgi:hypothetical protein
MNDLEYAIGNMINDENYRKKMKDLIEYHQMPDDLKIIFNCLQQEEFSMIDILKKGGKDIVVKAMDLANRAAKIKLTNEGKL